MRSTGFRAARRAGIFIPETNEWMRAAPAIQPRPPAPESAPRARWLWVAVAMLVLAGLGGAGLAKVYPWPPEAPVTLRVAEAGGQLEVEWDRTARRLREADSGKLFIRDGATESELPLDRQMLRQGRVVYSRRSGQVRIRLRLEKNGSTADQETVQYLAPAPADTAAK